MILKGIYPSMWIPGSFLNIIEMLIIRRKLFNEKDRDPYGENRSINKVIIDKAYTPKDKQEPIIKSTLSKLDVNGVYHSDGNIPKKRRLLKTDESRIRKAAEKGQMYIEFEDK